MRGSVCARAEFLDRLSDGATGNDVWTSKGHDGRRRAVSDRNVELLVDTPFSLASQG